LHYRFGGLSALVFLMLPLDHCLVSDDIRVADARTGESIGSDHLSLIVEIELEVEQ